MEAHSGNLRVPTVATIPSDMFHSELLARLSAVRSCTSVLTSAVVDLSHLKLITQDQFGLN